MEEQKKNQIIKDLRTWFATTPHASLDELLSKLWDEAMEHNSATKEVLKERKRQDAKWGEQNHHPFKWMAILGEEVGEANKAVLEGISKLDAKKDPLDKQEAFRIWKDHREELIQVAAVAIAAVESHDRFIKSFT